MASGEQWKAIHGFEGEYEVSNLGRVKSIVRWRRCIHKGKEVTRLYQSVLLKPGRRQSGHVLIALRGKTFDIHRLVMRAFVGPCPAGFEVLHMNHVPSDNRLSNLKYGTRSENVKMDFTDGKRTSCGRPRPFKLNPAQIKQVRSFKGINQRDLAKRFGVSQATIWAIRLDLPKEWKCKSGPKKRIGNEAR